MNRLFLPVCVLVVLIGSAYSQVQGLGQNGHVQANAATVLGEQNVPAPSTPRPMLDYGQVQREADELSALAQSVRADMQQVSKGLYPKEMNEKLKKIEKLSKRLRFDLSQ